jgi:hypothetical protein
MLDSILQFLKDPANLAILGSIGAGIAAAVFTYFVRNEKRPREYDGGMVLSPLQPGDHYVLSKLCDELLPWMISGRRVGSQWFVYLAAFYAYGGDFAAAVAGLGVGAPIVAFAQGKLPSGQNALDVLRSALPPSLFVVGLAALFFWVVVRLVVQREEVVARALLAREFARSINALYAQLWQGLAVADPMPKIVAIQKSVDERVEDAIKNRVWPYDPAPPPPAHIDGDLKKTVHQIRVQFMSRWAPPPPGAT